MEMVGDWLFAGSTATDSSESKRIHVCNWALTMGILRSAADTRPESARNLRCCSVGRRLCRRFLAARRWWRRTGIVATPTSSSTRNTATETTADANVPCWNGVGRVRWSVAIVAASLLHSWLARVPLSALDLRIAVSARETRTVAEMVYLVQLTASILLTGSVYGLLHLSRLCDLGAVGILLLLELPFVLFDILVSRVNKIAIRARSEDD